MPHRPEHPSAYLNEEMPDSFPQRNLGEIPVIVRLINTELGEHYRPAEACRWTSTHVMVALLDVDSAGKKQRGLAWLQAGDVYRILPGDVVPHRPGMGQYDD